MLPDGSYDGWPPLTIAAFARSGNHTEAARFLKSTAFVTTLGPYGQAHGVADPYLGSTATYKPFEFTLSNEHGGSDMVDAIITGIFGLQAAAAPALSHSAPTIADPQAARGVEGTLTAVRWQGQLHNAVAGADGVRWTRTVQAATAISPHGQRTSAASVGGPVSLQPCNDRSTVMAWHSPPTAAGTLGMKQTDGCLTVSLPEACSWCHPPRPSPPADVGTDVRTQPCTNSTTWRWQATSAGSGQLVLASNTSLCFGFRNNHGFSSARTATLEPCATDPAAPGEGVFVIGAGGKLVHNASGLCVEGSIPPVANTFVGGHPCDTAVPNLLTARPWCDVSKSIDERATALLAELRPEEKSCWFGGPSFTSGFGMTVTCGVPRLNISSFQWWHEALHGVKSTCSAVKNTSPSGAETSFPQPIGFAGSFNRTLVHAIGTAIGDEARALTQPYCGGTFWAPNVNTVHDPRWGRGQETPVRPIVAALLAPVLTCHVACVYRGKIHSSHQSTRTCS